MTDENILLWIKAIACLLFLFQFILYLAVSCKAFVKVKEMRNQDLLSQLEKQSYTSNSSSVGKRYEVLVEGKAKRGKGMLIGRTRCNRRVVFEGNQALAGELLDIEIKDVSVTTLIGTHKP